MPQGFYTNFKDGLHFSNHALFSDRSKISLRIQLFYDGMGSTNPLRGHTAPHVGMFYFTIQNLPKYFQTCNENVFLLAISYAADIKKYLGFDTILSRFMSDIKILETDGIVVNIPGRGDVNIFGSLSQFSGDCLAMNEVFGLV